MEIVVRGRNRPVPARLRGAVEHKVARIERVARDADRVEVDFSEARNPRVSESQQCEITLHMRKRLVRAHAASIEAEAAFDLAIDKVEHQVARIKDKRVGRAHPRRRVSPD